MSCVCSTSTKSGRDTPALLHAGFLQRGPQRRQPLGALAVDDASTMHASPVPLRGDQPLGLDNGHLPLDQPAFVQAPHAAAGR